MINRRNFLQSSALGLSEVSLGSLASKSVIAQSIGSPMTLFPVALLNGETFEPSQSKGNLVALYFFTTSCRACGYELPYIRDLYNEHKSKGVTILGLNVGDDQENVLSWTKKLNLSFPVAIASADYKATYLRGTATPTSHIGGRDGNLRLSYFGEPCFQLGLVRNTVKSILDEPRPAT